MAIRCKICIFRNRKGNQEPCINCAEIIDYHNTKNIINYFKSIDNNKDIEIETKIKLEERLDELIPHNKNTLIKFESNDKETIVSAFLLDNDNNLIIYQITDKNDELFENKIKLSSNLFEELKYFYGNVKKE